MLFYFKIFIAFAVYDDFVSAVIFIAAHHGFKSHMRSSGIIGIAYIPILIIVVVTVPRCFDRCEAQRRLGTSRQWLIFQEEAARVPIMVCFAPSR